MQHNKTKTRSTPSVHALVRLLYVAKHLVAPSLGWSSGVREDAVHVLTMTRTLPSPKRFDSFDTQTGEKKKQQHKRSKTRSPTSGRLPLAGNSPLESLALPQGTSDPHQRGP